MFDPSSTLSLPLSATVEERDNGILVVLDGELDLSAKEAFDRLLRDFAESGKEWVHVDLRELTFIDSTGIGLLLQGVRTAEENGFDIAFVPGDGHVWSVLETTGVAGRIPTVGAPA